LRNPFQLYLGGAGGAKNFSTEQGGRGGELGITTRTGAGYGFLFGNKNMPFVLLYTSPAKPGLRVHNGPFLALGAGDLGNIVRNVNCGIAFRAFKLADQTHLILLGEKRNYGHHNNKKTTDEIQGHE
jgi:hypothetical protein